MRMNDEKTILIIGTTDLAISLVKNILLTTPNYKIIMISDNNLYGISYANFWKNYIDTLDQNIVQSSSRKELRKLGVSKIHENSIIINIDSKKNTLTFMKKNDYEKEHKIIKYDYLIYADTPFSLNPDEALVYKKSPNVINLSDKDHWKNSINPFFQDFTSCAIIGSTYASVRLAMQLAKKNKTIHLIVKNKHLFKNIWDNILENEMLDDLAAQKINVIINPQKYEFKHKDKTIEINSIFVKNKNVVKKYNISVVFIAESKISTDLSLFTKFANFDYTYNDDYNVKRLITTNFQLNEKNCYALGIGAVEKSHLNKNCNNELVWADYLKNIDNKRNYLVHTFLHTIFKEKLGKKITTSLLKHYDPIDEYSYEGVFLKFIQLGKSFSFIRKNNKNRYGVIDISRVLDQYVGVKVFFELIINLDTEVIEGAFLKTKGPDELVLTKVFSSYIIFTSHLKQIIVNKISIGEILQSEYILEITPSVILKLWNSLYEKLLNYEIKK